MGPSDVAIGADGSVLVTYFGRDINSPRTAWRLYGPRDRVLGEGRQASYVEAAGDGFILSTPRGLLHVDTAGQTPVEWQEAKPRDVVAGDVFVADLGVYRPSEHVLFPGRADPQGRVWLSDAEGRFWALDRQSKRRTLVRFAKPGSAWKSLDLGPPINARKIVGRGSILMVVGPSKAYMSDDSGQSWILVTHGAQAYWGLPLFVVRPDRSVIAGDGRAGYVITTDHRIFRTATVEESSDILLGGLFSRRAGGHTEISDDHQQWESFSPEAVRRLSPTEVREP